MSEQQPHAAHAHAAHHHYADAPAAQPAPASEFAALLGGGLRATPEAAAFASLLGKPLSSTSDDGVRLVVCGECADPRCSLSYYVNGRGQRVR